MRVFAVKQMKIDDGTGLNEPQTSRTLPTLQKLASRQASGYSSSPMIICCNNFVSSSGPMSICHKIE